MLTYEQLLDRQPPSTAAGDRGAAARFVEHIDTFLAGRPPVPPSQRSYLYRLRTKWQHRASGSDAAWNEYGSKPGRRPKKKVSDRSDKIDTTVYGDEDQIDPLLASLARKYGTPRRTDDI